MAEKMDKQPAAPTRPVSVEKKQQQQPRTARPPFLHIDVHHVNLWMLLNAVAVTIFFAVGVAYYTLIVTRYPSHAATEMTDAEDTQAVFTLVIGMLWCSTPQAAAAALALLLTCHRWRVVRKVAAYAALVFTVVSHCLYAGVVLIFVRADPGDHFFKFLGYAGIFGFAVVDLLAFLVLLRREWAN